MTGTARSRRSALAASATEAPTRKFSSRSNGTVTTTPLQTARGRRGRQGMESGKRGAASLPQRFSSLLGKGPTRVGVSLGLLVVLGPAGLLQRLLEVDGALAGHGIEVSLLEGQL